MGKLESRIEEITKELNNISFTKLNSNSSTTCQESWSRDEIQQITNSILKLKGVTIRNATPIVKIAGDFSIKVFKATDIDNVNSLLSVNGNTSEFYGVEKVIKVKKNCSLAWQRYFVAIELGKYVLEFLGSKMDRNNEFYIHKNRKGHNGGEDAERFATEILMPGYAFLRQYLIANKNDIGEKNIYLYLSNFFEVPEEIVIDRIKEISEI